MIDSSSISSTPTATFTFPLANTLYNVFIAYERWKTAANVFCAHHSCSNIFPLQCCCREFRFPNQVEQTDTQRAAEPPPRFQGGCLCCGYHRVRHPLLLGVRSACFCSRVTANCRNLFARHDVSGGAWLSNVASTNYLAVGLTRATIRTCSLANAGGCC